MNRYENLFTVSSEFRSDYRVKGSKFFGFLLPCKTANQADEIVARFRDKFHDATHHCYAFRVNPVEISEFSQDDGEPAGTAGAPILNVLKSDQLVNVIAVVVRYYGGTKLGKSGLIEAYGKAAKICTEKADIKRVIQVQEFSISFDYDKQNIIDTLNHQFSWIELNAEYKETVTMKIACPIIKLDEFRKRISSVKHQLINVEELNKTFHITGR